MTETVIAPVREQLEAYNDKDIERFMRCWTDDCEYLAFPDTLLAQGAGAVRARHVERFREPGLHGALISRLVVGDVVIDKEIVRRTFPQGPALVEVMAIYQVRDGRIARAWFDQAEPMPLP